MGGVEIRNLERGIYFNLGAGLLNGMLGFWLFKSGTRLKSEALKADGLHILSDFYTTLGVAVGLVIVYWTGIAWLDPVIGFGISIILGITGFNLVRAASGALLDSQDTKMVSQISEAMNELRPNEVITVHELRAIRAGRYTHVDVHIVVPEYLPVREAHDIVDRFCTQVIQRARVEGEFHPHVDPCRKKYCAQCMINDCKIRAHPLQKREVITAESVVEIDPDEFEESRPF
jgi:cation diffusion facilitator family transporter